MPNIHDKLEARKALAKLLALGSYTEEQKAEAADYLATILEFAEKRRLASDIIREEVAKLDTTVDLGLPNVAPLDLTSDIEAIRELAENEAVSVKHIGEMIATAAPLVATAVLL